ncbi:MAG: LicD family protein [Prevotella sp.]|nr:LicD family protein [Prevotella sp.]
MTQKYLDKLQKKTLETLKFTIDFFEKHNLRYFAYGGTLLGAVRHKGFIPWDDDVDILMPSEDYERLLTLEQEISRQGHYIITYKTPEYYYTHTKLCSANTTIWENKSQPFIFGVFIDIFPVYRTNKDDNDINVMYRKYQYGIYKFQQANRKYSLASLKEKLLGKNYVDFRKDLKWMFVQRFVKPTLEKTLKNAEASFDEPCGNRIVPYSDNAYGLQIYKREWFEDYEITEFEDTKIRIPCGWDIYLKHVYGDYMQLPPEEKRMSRHDHYYLNLCEGLTIDEVRKRLKKGERIVL